MAKLELVKAHIRAGVWEGILSVSGGENVQPDLAVTHQMQPVEGVVIREEEGATGQFVVQVPIPAELLSDGVQTFIISDRVSGDTLSSFSIVTGQPLDDDIRAEVDLLREELDMLKRAFRRHCLETG